VTISASARAAPVELDDVLALADGSLVHVVALVGLEAGDARDALCEVEPFDCVA
jgi:hypothetical protein